MSYEEKIRDLMARLVGMAPEPPAFPEETHMAQRQEQRKPRPALVFAAAALVVAVLAIPVILLTGGEAPLAGGSTTTSTTVPETSTSSPAVTSTSAPETTTTSAEPTTTVPVSTTWTGTVFFYQTPQNSFLQNPALIPLSLELTDPSGELTPGDPFTEAMALLGPELPELPANANLANAIPGDVQILSLSTTTINGTEVWQADMNEAFLTGAGGLLADYTMLNQLIYTITWGGASDAMVLFTVNGEPVTAFGSEGLGLTDPVDRATFQTELALIYLTEPLLESNGGYQVTGIANAFEASLMVGVVDEDGEIVTEDPVQATCGSGCWGEFSITVPADLIDPGASSITALESSAEDGSPINVITVPIPAGDVWAITVGD